MSYPPRTVRNALAAMLAVAMVLPAAGPTLAIPLFELAPTPSPVPPQAGGRVVVDWAGLAMTFPQTWDVRVKRAPGVLSSGASVLYAFGPDEASCLLDRYDPELVEQWQDVGVQPAAQLTIGGLEVERFDDMLGVGASKSSGYTVYAPDFQYSLLCSAPDPPDDRWLSIVETLELI